MNILVVAKMPNSNLGGRIEPLAMLDDVDKIYLLREFPYPPTSAKIVNVRFPLTAWIPSPHIRRLLDGMIVLTSKRIDYIFAIHLHPHGYIGYFLSRLFNKKFILNTVAGLREFTVCKGIFKKITQGILKSDALFLVTGIKSKNFLKQLNINDDRIKIYNNVINIDKYKPRELDRDIDVLNVARMDENKNTYCLFRAIHRLKKEGLRVGLTIAGAGPSESKYRACVKELDIEDQIEFLGHCSHEKIAELNNRAKIFCLPSRGEGFPVSLLEAMASGVASIVTPVGDIADLIIHEHNGMMLDDPDDDESLAQYIKKLMTDASFRNKLVQNGFEVRTTRSFEAAAKNWEAIFEWYRHSSKA